MEIAVVPYGGTGSSNVPVGCPRREPMTGERYAHSGISSFDDGDGWTLERPFLESKTVIVPT